MATWNRSPPIGIDFGTTYSRVSVFRNGKVEIIPSRYGNLSTPNYVTFTDTEYVIGDVAKAKIMSPARNLVNTVFDVKRFMGAKYNSIHKDLKYYPFEVISDAEEKPKFSVDCNDENQTFDPEEIFIMILSQLKKDAEAYLDRYITDAVITVSPFFNFSQRQKIKEAASAAGLNAIRLIDDTTAATYTYTLQNNGVRVDGGRNVLIFDLGGGNLSVAVATIEDGIVAVKSITGNPHLGGVDFDNIMVTHFIKEFKRKYGRDISPNKRARLRAECQKAKQVLSGATRASIQIDDLFDSIDFHSSITRTVFELLNMDLFDQIIETVKKALRDAKMDKKNIYDIVMLGGSTHIPKVQELVKDFFNGKELNFSVDPDEAVVRGAAVHAAILTGSKDESLQELLLLEVTPVSLGIENVDGKMERILKRNTTFPTKETITVTTRVDAQRAVLIKIYEGERAMTKDNHLLRELWLYNVQESECNSQQVEVAIDLCADGIFTVTAVEKSTGNENHIEIGRKRNKVIDAWIDHIEEWGSIAAKRRLESYTADVQNVLGKIAEVNLWLSKNQNAKKHEYEGKKKYLEEACRPFITKLLQEGNANTVS